MNKMEVPAYTLRALNSGVQIIEYDFLDEITEPNPCDESIGKVVLVLEDATAKVDPAPRCPRHIVMGTFFTICSQTLQEKV